MKLIIFTGKINSGKTTSLLEWSKNKEDVFGYLQIKKENERYFYNLTDKNIKQLTVSDNGSSEVIKVGNYIFNKKVFDEINKEIMQNLCIKDKGYLIIDEWGYLELENSGNHNAVKYILENTSKTNLVIIVVVREQLVTKFIEKYSINHLNYSIITSISELD